jgi:hypothetical protein
MHRNRWNMARIVWALFGLLMLAYASDVIRDTRAASAPAAGQTPAVAVKKGPITIKQVMKEAHKKPSELLKKVAMGKASDKQKARLLELYTAMAKTKPPKGDIKGWKEKCGLLITAAKAAVDGKPDAKKLLAKASNCKGCHKLYKD